MPTELTETAHAAGRLLAARGETIAVAESSAGGLISAALLSVPGASAFYVGGTVIYTVVAARRLLVDAAPVPDGVRGASDPFARYLAGAIAAKLGSTWGLAETGAAGPDANRYGDPAGHAWVAVAGPGAALGSTRVATGSAVREANMWSFAAAALGLLVRGLER
jgi:nicotinamide-nucleotide amidase